MEKHEKDYRACTVALLHKGVQGLVNYTLYLKQGTYGCFKLLGTGACEEVRRLLVKNDLDTEIYLEVLAKESIIKHENKKPPNKSPNT